MMCRVWILKRHKKDRLLLNLSECVIGFPKSTFAVLIINRKINAKENIMHESCPRASKQSACKCSRYETRQ